MAKIGRIDKRPKTCGFHILFDCLVMDFPPLLIRVNSTNQLVRYGDCLTCGDTVILTIREEDAIKLESTQKLPWGILVLFGGGLALAGTLQQSYWLPL